MKNIFPGISLIETVVLIGIISISLIGSALLLTISINANVQNKNRFTATYLTQECLELARNLRDSAWRQNLPWDAAFEENGNYNNEFVIQNSSPNFSEETDSKSSLGASILPYSAQGAKINWIDGTLTKFSRTLTTSKTEKMPDEIQITCETSWKRKNKTERIQISEILTNWKK